MTDESIPKSDALAAFYAFDQSEVDLYAHAHGYAAALWETQETV